MRILTVFLIIALLQNDEANGQKSVSSNSASEKIDSNKTVAIYSSKKTIFKDFPIDSLVKYLNIYNENPKVIFCKNTEDNSRTGFYADYVLDLDLWIKPSQTEAPKWVKKRIQKPISKAFTERDGSVTHYITMVTVEEEEFVQGSLTPGSSTIIIKMTQKWENEKVTKYMLTANGDDKKVEPTLLVKLVYALLDYFENIK